jgi:N-hydroxyarylamine O-acetyltransferase
MNLDAYLSRLGFSGPLPPSVETLKAIQIAHLAAFPFHNLDIQRRLPVSVDVAAIEKKFHGRDGGGYCFEQNTLLSAALRALGFEVATLLGRAGPPEKKSTNHMLLMVTIDGEKWIADVGFGGEGPFEPMPLREGARSEHDGMTFELGRGQHRWTISVRYGDVVEELYDFCDVPQSDIDVEMANYYISTHPSSIFRRTATIQRITADERIILRPTVFTRYKGGVRTDTPIDGVRLRELARELFGFEIGEEALLFEMEER